PSIREVVASTLHEESYTVLLAASGSEALNLTRSHHVDIAILDILMPGMGGIETAARMREDRASSHIPIVILSVLPKDQVAVPDNVILWIEKPFDPSDLLAALVSAIENRGKIVVVETDDDSVSRAETARTVARVAFPREGLLDTS
ncbi:MAG: response regulator, partial [Actinomycetota bacterium]